MVAGREQDRILVESFLYFERNATSCSGSSSESGAFLNVQNRETLPGKSSCALKPYTGTPWGARPRATGAEPRVMHVQYDDGLGHQVCSEGASVGFALRCKRAFAACINGLTKSLACSTIWEQLEA